MVPCLGAGAVPALCRTFSWTHGPRRCPGMVSGLSLAAQLGSAMAKDAGVGRAAALRGGDTLKLGCEPSTQKC